MANLSDAISVEEVMWKGKRLGDMDRVELLAVIYYLLASAKEQDWRRSDQKSDAVKEEE